MANLLDRASVVLTPTAYNNGEVLCVKPDDASGDFQFSRNSAATRVNAQGLVEDVQILSSNLVQNGSFSQLGSEEITNGNFSQQGSDLTSPVNFLSWSQASIDSRTANSFTVGGSGRGLYYLLPENKTLKIKVSGLTGSAEIRLRQTASGAGTVLGSTDTNLYVTTTNATTNLYLRATQAGTVSVTDVSVVEVGQDWTFSSGATLTDLGAKITHTPTAGIITQQFIVIGKQYKFTYEITESVAGGLKLNSAINTSMVTSVGIHTKYFEADSSGFSIARTSASNNDVTITNISVKEVGQNWTFPNDWEVGNNKIIGLGSGFGGLQQTISLQNKKIKVTFDILDYVSGTFRVPPTYRQDGLDERFSGNGSYEVIYTSLVDFFTFQPQLFDGSITNISVIEITDDTNLPRINYEGFSYQDALGSEEVVNGDGSSTTGWGVAYSNTTLSINNNNLRATANASGAYGLSQVLSLDTSKQYLIKATINVDSASGGTANLRLSTSSNLGSGATTLATTTGTSTTILTPSSSTMYIGIVDTANNSSNFVEISNISVKEYLGQEVVPDSGCGSWLWEPQSTNLIPYSEDFSNSSWTKTNVSVASNSVTSPDGTINADYLQENTANGTHIIRRTFALNASDYTLSVFAKQGIGSTRQVGLFFNELVTGALFNLNDGSVAALVGSPVVKSQEIGNGWFKFSITVTSTAISVNCRIYLGKDGVWTGAWVGDGNSGVYIWGAQLEEQSYSTSYIPTSGQASGVTRNKDVCTNGGSAASINSTEGVLYAEIAALANDGTNRSVSISNGNTSNRITIRYRPASGQIQVVVVSGSITQALITKTGLTTTNFAKVALKYSQNDFALWVNGVEVGTDTNGLTPIGLNKLSFDRADGANNFFGKTKCLAVFPFLTDTELAELTTI